MFLHLYDFHSRIRYKIKVSSRKSLVSEKQIQKVHFLSHLSLVRTDWSKDTFDVLGGGGGGAGETS